MLTASQFRVACSMETNIISLKLMSLFALHLCHAYEYSPLEPGDFYTNTYLLEISEYDVDAVEDIGRNYNLTMETKILDDLYVFRKNDQADQEMTMQDPLKDLQQFRIAVGNKVTHIERQVSIEFNIPQTDVSGAIFIEDILLTDNHFPDVSGVYYDLGIEEAWSRGYYGNNVTVAIVDVGLEMSHEDLDENVNTSLCYNYLDRNNDASSPNVTSYPDEFDISHGTKCAGLVAAEKGNKFCSAGVAPKATLVSIRFLGEDPLRRKSRGDIIASALGHKKNEIDIYSNSWGYAQRDLIKGPHAFKRALETGVIEGRDGKGNIFVFPAGNYPVSDDSNTIIHDCNTNGMANNIQGITVSSVGMNGRKPTFIPVCTSVLAATLGEGSKINTNTMYTTSNNNDCTDSFTMTSASVALASGMIALMLQANGNLSWRDVQHVLVETSSQELVKSQDFIVNGAGKKVSKHFGFGLMNASAIVDAASKWTAVPEQHTCDRNHFQRSETFKEMNAIVEWVLDADGCMCTKSEVKFLEHVEVELQLRVPRRSSLSVFLSSPSSPQMKSPILSLYPVNTDATLKWKSMTVHFWGEDPHGEWRLLVEKDKEATIEGAKLIMYGTATDPRKGADTQTSNGFCDVKALAINSSASKWIVSLLVIAALVCAIGIVCYKRKTIKTALKNILPKNESGEEMRELRNLDSSNEQKN